MSMDEIVKNDTIQYDEKRKVLLYDNKEFENVNELTKYIMKNDYVNNEKKHDYEQKIKNILKEDSIVGGINEEQLEKILKK